MSAELESAFRTIKASLSGLPPVRSAIDGLEGCLTRIKEQTPHEYEEIASDLIRLANLIQTQVTEKTPSYVPRSIANIARAIEEQTSAIKANQDAEAMLESHRKARALVQKLYADISLGVWDVSQEQQMNLQIKDLCPANDAYHNAALSGSVTKRTGCTEGTRVELLDATQVWIHDESAPRIHWLNGMAGTGKTTIAYSVCEMLQEKYQLGGNFFCSRNFPDCRDVNRIVPTIAYQLGRYSNPYRKAVCDVLRDDPDVAKRNIRAQFKLLILGPLAEMGKAMPTDVVVVIDALDECIDTDGVQDLLGMILQYANNLPVKFFISSRPEPEISECMAALDGATCSVVWLHDVEKSLVQADINIRIFF